MRGDGFLLTGRRVGCVGVEWNWVLVSDAYVGEQYRPTAPAKWMPSMIWSSQGIGRDGKTEHTEQQ